GRTGDRCRRGRRWRSHGGGCPGGAPPQNYLGGAPPRRWGGGVFPRRGGPFFLAPPPRGGGGKKKFNTFSPRPEDSARPARGRFAIWALSWAQLRLSSPSIKRWLPT